MEVYYLNIIDWYGKTIIVEPHDIGKGVEVSWEFNGNKITKSVIDPGKSVLYACLSPSHEEIIIISSRLKDSDSSAEATVFNLDGSVRFYLIPPALVSDEYKKYEKKVGADEAVGSIYIIQPEIKIVDGNEMVLLWIGFSYDWFEVREVNVKTGEFGKCFGSSRM
jgi:hypothetical protein